MRYLIIGGILFALAVAIIAGPRGLSFKEPPIEIFPDMDRQAKVKYQKPSAFFADGRAARQPVQGTVPMGYRPPASGDATHILNEISYSRGKGYLSTGKIGTFWGNGIPKALKLDQALLKRGQERYDIYCILCHGATGSGNGIVTKYGFTGIIPSYHDQRLLDMPDGEIYNTLTNGKGQMEGYGASLSLRDRWAIIAYIRALQKTRQGTLDELDETGKKQLGLEDATPSGKTTHQ